MELLGLTGIVGFGDSVVSKWKLADMEKLLECFRSFNWKERFYVIGAITGNREFELCDEFRAKLQGTFDLTLPKKGIFTAMDYHIDWIAASLVVCFQSNKYPKGIYSNGKRFITANQEDVDLLIAYCVEDICHIIMVEAKATTAWTNKQLNSKAKRLKSIFGDTG